MADVFVDMPIEDFSFPEIVKRLEAAAAEMGALTRREIAFRSPVDTGTLRGSFRQSVSREGGHIVIRIVSPLSYATPQEEGFGGDGVWPPAAPLRRWVERKNLAKRKKDVDSITFLVRRKIAFEGVKALKFIMKGLGAAQLRFGQIISRHLEGSG